jgi:aminoglycoside phosphotransferase family enzyme/predicted kinase
MSFEGNGSAMQTTQYDQGRLIAALCDAGRYPHPAAEVERIETHISSVLLAGEYAYKIKKPLNLGFLDFSTLEDRRHYCEEELRLNARLAPDLYLEVVPIGGTPAAPELGARDGVFEYAVKMRRFDQSRLLDRLLAGPGLDPVLMDRIATRMAQFHEVAAVAEADSPFGTPEAVLAPMLQNFEQLRPLLNDPDQLAQLERLEAWTRARHEALAPLLARRKAEGCVRECHGDMHLGNMAMVDDELAIFDGIEFNDAFRWIDVMSELAFLTMDLDDRGAQALSNRVLNAYLEASGDYPGLALLRFYQVYRALVRAKVASIRLGQGGLDEDERAGILRAYQSYADLAERYTMPPRAGLFITHGVSGSGKTTTGSELVEGLGLIRLRSDVERKRLAGLAPLDRATAPPGEGLYGPEADARCYARLLELAGVIAEAGHTVLVDATFLARARRLPFQALAEQRGLPYAVLVFEADTDQLRARILARQDADDDASDAGVEVMEAQLQRREPPGPDEPQLAVGSGLAEALRALRDAA